MVRNQAHTVSKYLKDHGVIRIAQARCRLDQRIEYFLHVEGRPADDLQNIGSGRLLFQGFCQLALARLLSLKQPRVLDGDHCLVGEGLEQIDLSVGERADLGASDDNHADGLTCTNQRDGQYSAVSKASGIIATLRILVAFSQHIGDVNRLAVEDGTSGDNPTCKGQRVTPYWNFGYRPMVRYEALTVTVHLRD